MSSLAVAIVVGVAVFLIVIGMFSVMNAKDDHLQDQIDAIRDLHEED